MTDEETTSPTTDPWQVDLVDDGEIWDPVGSDEPHALVDLVNRLLDKGVVIRGEVMISVAGVELVYLGLNALLTSITTAREHLRRGISEPG